MEYILLGIVIFLIFINLIVLIVLLKKIGNKNISEQNISDRISRLEINTVKELGDFREYLNRTINDDFNSLNNHIETQLRVINDRVNERIDENFEKTNKTFNSVLERLARIDEAQKKIDSLSTDIVSLQSILTDKKARGIFGEVNLKHIMESVFGVNDKLYQLQYSFSNGTIVDCAVFAPNPVGIIGIDSKFPLENYRVMVDRNAPEKTRIDAARAFKLDVKRHIDAISSKYIIPGITTDQAIMFLPAEAVFAEIQAYHYDLVDYAMKKRVWMTSPTTLLSTLTTLQIIIRNVERDKYALIIEQELKLLGAEFGRYKERWDKLYRSIETVSKDVRDIYTTSEKISKRFNSINKVEIEDNKLIDYEE